MSVTIKAYYHFCSFVVGYTNVHQYLFIRIPFHYTHDILRKWSKSSSQNRYYNTKDRCYARTMYDCQKFCMAAGPGFYVFQMMQVPQRIHIVFAIHSIQIGILMEETAGLKKVVDVQTRD